MIKAIEDFVYHPFPFLPPDGRAETYEAMRAEREAAKAKPGHDLAGFTKRTQSGPS